MSQAERGDEVYAESHRTLRFAAMRDNIAECVARVDAQTFGVQQDVRSFGAGVETVSQ